jgi:hypothetical protein
VGTTIKGETEEGALEGAGTMVAVGIEGERTLDVAGPLVTGPDVEGTPETAGVLAVVVPVD